jgi:dTMP kinase
MTQSQGKFISIEGIEGVGKSTAIKFIEKYLTERQLNFILTREPGGTSIAEIIRKVLLSHYPDELMAPETELLLMFACRAQHLAAKIKPALEQGCIVVSDRFVDASYAYQAAGRGLDENLIASLDKQIVGACLPDVTILLDASPEVSLQRLQTRGEQQDRIEIEKTEFFARVREGYLRRVEKHAYRFHVIDASLSIEIIHTEIAKILDNLLDNLLQE